MTDHELVVILSTIICAYLLAKSIAFFVKVNSWRKYRANVNLRLAELRRSMSE